MSDILEAKEQIMIRDVVVGKKCDVCKKDIPPTTRGGIRKATPFFAITTHHNDWGNDSCDSYEHFDACSPDCALRFIEEYLREDFEGTNSKVIEIEHVPAWYKPLKVADE